MGKMTLHVKHYTELSRDELYKIYKARCEVFVVEQNCAYQDIDDADKSAYHLWLEDESGLAAYLRVLPQGVTYEEASIGRVISLRRRQGLATRLLLEGIALAKEKFAPDRLKIGAQTYAVPLYEGVGFVSCHDPYIEDGIEHVHMILDL